MRVTCVCARARMRASVYVHAHACSVHAGCQLDINPGFPPTPEPLPPPPSPTSHQSTTTGHVSLSRMYFGIDLYRNTSRSCRLGALAGRCGGKGGSGGKGRGQGNKKILATLNVIPFSEYDRTKSVRECAGAESTYVCTHL